MPTLEKVDVKIGRKTGDPHRQHARVSAKDKSPHPFPAAPALVLPTVHLKWDVNGL